MAVKIKLKRLGKKRNPQYRIVVADARTRRDGRAIEEIGIYHPKKDPSLIRIDSERAQYWLGVGALPTEAVQRLLEITGDWQTFKGLPGTEGTLRVAEESTDKKTVFAAAVADAAGEKDRYAQEMADKAKAEKAAAAAAAEAAVAEAAAAAEAAAEAEVAVAEAAEGSAAGEGASDASPDASADEEAKA